jgi:galactonate dehydratase
MKISAVHAYPVWVGNRNQLIVKVETDEGLYGWGESGMSYRERAVVGAVEHYREFLIGRDPMRTGSLWQEMYRSQYFEGGRVLAGAISAIDIALHDIKGKALGVPVYELLGGKHRERVPIDCGDRALARSRPRGARGRCGARHRLPSSVERRRGGVVLPEDAFRNARFPRRADSR